MAAVRTTFFLSVWTTLWFLYGAALMALADSGAPGWLLYMPVTLLIAMPAYGALCGVLVTLRRWPFMGLLMGGGFGVLGAAAAYLVITYTSPPFYLLAGVLGGVLTEAGINLAAAEL
jgi:hypothetical protein